MNCLDCGMELEEEAVQVKLGRRKLKLCEDCADIRHQQDEIAGMAEASMQGMMEYKGT